MIVNSSLETKLVLVKKYLIPVLVCRMERHCEGNDETSRSDKCLGEQRKRFSTIIIHIVKIFLCVFFILTHCHLVKSHNFRLQHIKSKLETVSLNKEKLDLMIIEK